MQNPNTYQIDNLIFKRTIGYNAINSRIFELANQINNDYKDNPNEPVFLITLKGAIFFATQLLKNIYFKHTIDTATAKSYGNAMKSENVDIQLNINSFKNKDIIIIEDIIDTGKTIIALTDLLQQQQPNSIAIATLINKPLSHNNIININYTAFEIDSDAFIIGFGLDYKEYGRNLNGLYLLAN